MNWSAIEAISAAIATAATLVTLIYLAIQLREANKLSRSASLQSVLEGYLEHVVAPMSNDKNLDVGLRGAQSFSSLTVEERALFQNDLVRRVLHFQNVMQLHKNGLLDEQDFQVWMKHTAGFLKTKGGSECWQEIRQAVSPSLTETLDHFILEHPDVASHTETLPSRYKS